MRQLRAHGRKDFGLKHEGQYLDSRAAEAKIRALPGVLEVAYLMIENRLGKAKKILVLMKAAGEVPTSVSIKEFCIQKFGKDEQPDEVVFLNEWPKDNWGNTHRIRIGRDLKGTF